MTGYQIGGEWLDFAGTIGVELRSPLFDTNSIPGVLTYPAAFTDTPRNRRLLGFPAVRARRTGPVPAVAADFYVGGLLWRRGLLQFKDFDSEKGEYSYQFQADADALANLIGDVLLSELPLGRLPVQLVAETDDYVLAPIRNNTFYDPDKNPDWCKIVNYYTPAGAFATNSSPAHRYTIVPLLKVVPLLRRCLAVYGYEVVGPWLDDPEIQKLVLYSVVSLDQATSSFVAADFALADLLPDVRLAELLLTLQKLFALAFVFDPFHKRVRVVPLRDVVAGTAYQARTTGTTYRDVASEVNGFTLVLTADSDDELLKSMPWPELTIGAGKEKIQPAADTLRLVREDDPTGPAPTGLPRAWLVPAAEQAGRSARSDFEQTDVRSSQLRFLFYRGLQPDGTGAYRYPLVSAGTENYAGTQVGNYALAWDGPQGLYQQWHKPWLDFRANARIEERNVRLSLGEFLVLDPTRPDLVQGLTFLWEGVSITVGGTETLEDATITYHQLTP
jgi:hypothetical protein